MAVAPVDKVEQVLRFATSVIPSDHIFMGIPNYGYDWTLPYVSGESVARALSNVEAIDQAIQVGAYIQFDENAQSPWYTYWRNNTEHEVWFEDVRSMQAKFDLIRDYGLNGAGYWQIMRLFRANWILLSGQFEIMQYFPQLWMVLNSLFEIEKLS